MRKLKTLLLLLTITSLTGCFTIKQERNPEDRACKLITKELTLEFEAHEFSTHHGAGTGAGGAGLLIVPAMVLMPTISFIVSGTTVLLGNVVHWVEKQGKCTDEQINLYAKKHTSKIVKKGGKVVKTPENFADWLKKRNEQNTDTQTTESHLKSDVIYRE